MELFRAELKEKKRHLRVTLFLFWLCAKIYYSILKTAYAPLVPRVLHQVSVFGYLRPGYGEKRTVIAIRGMG